jgi:hypothetical protein
VQVADRLVWGLGFDNGAKRVGPDFDPQTLAEIGVSPSLHEQILADIKALAEQVESSLA